MSRARIALVVAVARNGIIGDQDKLPWVLPGELRRFRKRTTGHPVIMGRKTFEGIGKALPDRDNIVLTRQDVIDDPGVITANSVEEAISLAERLAATRKVREIMVIGGGEIYDQFRGRADRVYYTEVDMDVDGDTHFRSLDPANWREVKRETVAAGKGDSASYTIITYDRATKT